MKHNDFAEQILKEIEGKNLKPTAKWKFVVVHSLLVASGILALLIGSLAVAAGLFVLLNSDVDVYRALHGSGLSYMIKNMPLLWILSMIVFIVIADVVFKQTGKGYRYALWALILASLLISIILGSFLYLKGIGHVVEYRVGRHVPLYTDVFEQRANRWTNPEGGLLVGSVNFQGSTTTLTDKNGKQWLLNLEAVPYAQRLVFEHASTVATVGRFDEETGSFIVCAARPWIFNGEAIPAFGIPFKSREGLEHIDKGSLDKIRNQLRNQEINERNLFEIRNTLCSPQKVRPSERRDLPRE
jgi:hypothetical protein